MLLSICIRYAAGLLTIPPALALSTRYHGVSPVVERRPGDQEEEDYSGCYPADYSDCCACVGAESVHGDRARGCVLTLGRVGKVGD